MVCDMGKIMQIDTPENLYNKPNSRFVHGQGDALLLPAGQVGGEHLLQAGEAGVLHGLLHEGECFSFLGPSGCGKSTTLRMIAGFEDLIRGRVTSVRLSMWEAPQVRAASSREGWTCSRAAEELFIEKEVSLVKAYGLPLIPENFTLQNYQRIFAASGTIDSVKNSLFVSISPTSTSMMERAAPWRMPSKLPPAREMTA